MPVFLCAVSLCLVRRFCIGHSHWNLPLRETKNGGGGRRNLPLRSGRQRSLLLDRAKKGANVDLCCRKKGTEEKNPFICRPHDDIVKGRRERRRRKLYVCFAPTKKARVGWERPMSCITRARKKNWRRNGPPLLSFWRSRNEGKGRRGK